MDVIAASFRLITVDVGGEVAPGCQQSDKIHLKAINCPADNMMKVIKTLAMLMDYRFMM